MDTSLIRLIRWFCRKVSLNKSEYKNINANIQFTNFGTANGKMSPNNSIVRRKEVQSGNSQ